MSGLGCDLLVVPPFVLVLVHQFLEFARFRMEFGLQRLEVADQLITHLQGFQFEGVVPAQGSTQT